MARLKDSDKKRIEEVCAAILFQLPDIGCEIRLNQNFYLRIYGDDDLDKDYFAIVQILDKEKDEEHGEVFPSLDDAAEEFIREIGTPYFITKLREAALDLAGKMESFIQRQEAKLTRVRSKQLQLLEGYTHGDFKK